MVNPTPTPQGRVTGRPTQRVSASAGNRRTVAYSNRLNGTTAGPTPKASTGSGPIQIRVGGVSR